MSTTPRPFQHAIDNLRLGEFDLGGVLYHANYFHLYEAAREALLAENDLPYSTLVAEDCHLAIVEAHQHFYQPIFYGELLAVELTFRELKQSQVTADYQIRISRDSRDCLVHSGWTRLAYVTASGGKLKAGRIPEKLLKIIRKYQVPREEPANR